MTTKSTENLASSLSSVQSVYNILMSIYQHHELFAFSKKIISAYYIYNCSRLPELFHATGGIGTRMD